MGAWILVSGRRFPADTDEPGRFRLPPAPPGPDESFGGSDDPLHGPKRRDSWALATTAEPAETCGRAFTAETLVAALPFSVFRVPEMHSAPVFFLKTEH
jgi:hypothetical protein